MPEPIPIHADIYRAILSLYERRQSIDFVTVTEELREHRTINAIGGAAFLAQLAQEVPTSSHAQTYHEDCDDPTLTDFYLRKNRNGPTGHIELKFNAARMSFLQ